MPIYSSAVQPKTVASIRHADPSSSQGSRTIIITDTGNRPSERSNDNPNPASVIVRARPLNEIQHRQPRVQWQENVIDNEGLGRKKSKVCCIYNKPKGFDESSDESDHSDLDCCTSHASATSNQVPANLNSQGQLQPSFSLPTSPRSSNAYEVEPTQTKGKGKA